MTRKKINDGLTNKQRFEIRHPDYYRKHLDYYRKYQKDHYDHSLKINLRFYHEHKSWIIKNCIICGKFCQKYSRKYCKDCGYIMDLASQYLRN